MKITLTLLIFSIFAGNISGQSSTYESKFDEIISIRSDESYFAPVTDIQIFREDISFHLKNGSLVFGQNINNDKHVAVFLGEADINYMPGPEIEKDQLLRFTEDENFNKSVDFIFFLFSDSTFQELENKLTFTEAGDLTKHNQIIEESFRYLYNDDTKDFHSNIMKVFLEETTNGFFHSHFRTTGNDLFSYQFDPYAEEEIQFQKGYSYINHKLYDNINRYKSKSPDIRWWRKENSFIRLDKYLIEVEIDKEKDYSAKTEVRFQTRLGNQKWLSFHIFEDLKVDSVFLGETRIPFFKGEESEKLWINFQNPLKWRQNYSLSIYCSGDLLRTNTKGWIFIRSSGKWFPRFGIRNYANYELKFKYPKELALVSTGEHISTKAGGDYKTSTWKSKSKLRNTSFNIGSFKEYSLKSDSLPEIKVYHSKYGHSGSINNAERVIAEDIQKMVKFFQDNFGPLNRKILYATEIPYYHGEAFPGFLHLSFTTFQYNDYYGLDQVFRAHEVAHQWWAIDLDFEVYRDQWLSEAFAEYSGILYLQNTSGFVKGLDYLDEYRDKILYNRKYLFGDGQESGPIYLGYRTSGKDTRGDYNLVIYKKGAWVLHMLRMMMIDLVDLNDRAFYLMLRDFFNSFQGGMANTEDFKKIVEKHFNNDMDWFFRQWIYGTFIPDIEFAYKISKEENDNYLIEFKTDVKDAPDGYLIYPIIKVINADDKVMRFRVPLSGGKSNFQLKLTSAYPESIEFNNLNSILCDVSLEDWDDL